MRPAATGANGTRLADRDASFGQRRGGTSGGGKPYAKSKASEAGGGGGLEVSWVPSGSSGGGMDGDADSAPRPGKPKPRKGVEVFGAGMEKGYAGEDLNLSEQDRKGRTQRRKGIRSGSKNVFRSMNG
jgi:ribosome biogenesis protein ENP2